MGFSLKKRIKVLFGIFEIGSGVLAFIAPRMPAWFWLFGPQSLRRISLWFADNPTYSRLGAIGGIGFGIWVALSQYREAPQPWYQRWYSQQYRLASWLALLGLLIGILLFAVIYRRSRGEGSTVEEQEAREEMRRIIRWSFEGSRHQR